MRFSRFATIAEDRQLQILYSAACSAALAAEREISSTLDEAARSNLRAQALGWLTSELEQWQKFLKDNDNPEAKALVTEKLQHWQKDSDLRPSATLKSSLRSRSRNEEGGRRFGLALQRC